MLLAGDFLFVGVFIAASFNSGSGVTGDDLFFFFVGVFSPVVFAFAAPFRGVDGGFISLFIKYLDLLAGGGSNDD